MEAKPKAETVFLSSSLSSSTCPSWRAQLASWLLPSVRLKRRFWPILLGASYVLAIKFAGGLKPEHVLLGSLSLLDAYNEKTRLFLAHFWPFIMTGIAYDAMRYFYWQGIEGHVHVAEPYHRDLSWFGIRDASQGNQVLTPNEYFAAHTSVVLDVLCGFAYLTFVAEYLLAAFYLFLGRRLADLQRFGLSFLIVNLLGFVTYFVYPAAPPWYVTQYGLGPARMDVHPFPAAAHRFDLLFGTHFFDQIYGHGVDVYGAYPSLHVSYPFLVLLICLRLPELRPLRLPAAGFYILMCLSAVYLQHHYVVDILLGTAYACVTWWVTGRLLGITEPGPEEATP